MQYYYSNNGTDQVGPFTLEELSRQGITAQTLIWHEGLSNWTPAGQLPDLAPAMATPPVANDVALQVSAPTPHPPQPIQYQSPYAQPQATNGLAIASLVLGIIGLPTFCWYVPGILAVVFGHLARQQIRRSKGTGEGLALAGLIMGYISIGLGTAYLIFIVIAMTAGNF